MQQPVEGTLHIRDCNLNSTTAQPGDEVLFSHTVENTGAQDRNATMVVTVGGLEAARLNVFVQWGQTDVVTTAFDVPQGLTSGDHAVEVSLENITVA